VRTGSGIANVVVLDEPYTQPINGRGVYSFYAKTFNNATSTIVPLLMRPLTEDDHSDPSSLQSWEIVAAGTERVIPGEGFYEFEFGLISGSVSQRSGLYFGWRDGSDGSGLNLTAVQTGSDSSSNAFSLNSSFSNGIQAGSINNRSLFQRGFSYSMKAKFEVEEVNGLVNPQTITFSPDGSGTFYTGDQAGVVAAWERLPSGDYRLRTSQAFLAEAVVGSSASQFGRAVEVSFRDDRSRRIAASNALTANFGPGIASAGDNTFESDPDANNIARTTGGGSRTTHFPAGDFTPSRLLTGSVGAFANQSFRY
jgi:hypothetical protein